MLHRKDGRSQGRAYMWYLNAARLEIRSQLVRHSLNAIAFQVMFLLSSVRSEYTRAIDAVQVLDERLRFVVIQQPWTTG